MKNICLLSDSFPPVIDGVANAVTNYAKVLKNNNYGVCAVTPKVNGFDYSALEYPVIPFPSIDIRKAIGYVAGVPLSGPVTKQLNNYHPDLLHSHSPMSGHLVARGLRESFDIPLVMTYHTKYDIDIANAIRGKAVQRSLLKMLEANIEASDEVWVVSKGAGENLRSIGYPRDYVVMENGVDLPKCRLSDQEIDSLVDCNLDLPKSVPLFLFVGRLMWYKGIRIILDAMATLKSQNKDFRMVFIGKGADEKEIKTYTTELNLNDKCFFLGPIYDRKVITAWYSKADLFLFPSTFDTNGLVVREAAACSLGTVMIQGSCAAEGVIDKRNGLFIEENAQSLVSCLSQVMNSKETMRNIGDNAGNELYLSWDDAVKKAMERYEIVIDNYKSGKYPK